MIKASISPLHEAIFRPYIRGLLKKHFNAIHLLGEIPDFGDRAILLLPNHSTWWDGFFVHILKVAVLQRPTYLMMLEEQLSRNRFFSHVGAFSINPASAKDNLRSLTYASQLLHTPEKPLVCIFPQGVLLPWGVRPLNYKRGIELVLKKMHIPVNVCQIGFKCEFLDGQRADVFFELGDNIIYEPDDAIDIKTLQECHENLLENMATKITNKDKGRLILQGKRPINESFEALRQKLGLMRGEQ